MANPERKPIIGITTECEADPENARTRGNITLNWNYAEQVAQAGGVPLIIPPTADMGVVAGLIDGWLIPGGDDIDASNFGEENHPKVNLGDPARFDGERRLYAAVPKDMPVFGICYGCQFLNVIRGGSLIQHLPDAVGHERHHSGGLEKYALEATAKLAGVTGVMEIEGKSYHHQAIGRIGGGLNVVARADDNTVEALEAADRPFMIGVQWHPERTPDDPATQNLFKKFVEAARLYASTKGGTP